MMNDSIYEVGSDLNNSVSSETTKPDKYLSIDKELKEFSDAGIVPNVLKNLGVYSKEEVEDLINDITDSIYPELKALDKDILELSGQLLDILVNQANLIKSDGSVPFTSTPYVNKESLITERTLNNKLSLYPDNEVLRTVKNELDRELEKRALVSNVYTLDKLYTREQIDRKLSDYTNDIISKADRDYVRNLIKKLLSDHIMAPDPHKLKEFITNKLRGYYKIGLVYSRNETYNRGEINSIIDKLVNEACDDLIATHTFNVCHLTELEVRTIIREYAKDWLVSNNKLSETIDDINVKIDNSLPIWKTSGPVLTTVGFIEDNTELPPELTLLLVLDLIFYGSKISISADDGVLLGEYVDITICLHTGIPVLSIILYQNGVEVDSFDLIDFEEGCITRPYGPIKEDTEFTLKVIYLDGIELLESITVHVQLPLFVGIIPKMKPESNINTDYLKDLILLDSINNEFVNNLPIVHKYNFKDSNLLKVIVGIPTLYNKELEYMSNSILKFSKEAFNFHRIPLTFGEDDETASFNYDFYTYILPVSSLSSEVTFNFISK